MKHTFKIAALVAALTLMVLPVVACAEAVLTETQTVEPFTWQYLATIAGSSAFTLLVVQFLKAPLDTVWKIPTRAFAYGVSLAVMLVATAFTTGITPNSALLSVVNAFLSALTAMGAYEMTFAKTEKTES